jgi:BirA family transcriptional regulator, biotin operon repressor / biotin---[acetyl-CoA-carboxylase] ligase
MRMAGVRVPELLNQLLLAGEAGLRLDPGPEMASDLRILLHAGIPLSITGGRVILSGHDDVMVPERLRREVALTSWRQLEVIGFVETSSTNEEALSLVRNGARTGTVVYAEEQTAGKGRLGRTWFSPPGTGIYLSVILRPTRPMDSWPLLSLAASAALVRALQEICVENSIPSPCIESKWPNDVLISGKKTAGILIEAAKSGSDSFAVIGCGINVSSGSIPPGLESQATAVSQEFGIEVSRCKIAAKFLLHLQSLWALFEAGQDGAILETYKAGSSIWNGVAIWVMEGSSKRPATTCGLSTTGGLRVRTESGREETLLAAEVSIRHQ